MGVVAFQPSSRPIFAQSSTLYGTSIRRAGALSTAILRPVILASRPMRSIMLISDAGSDIPDGRQMLCVLARGVDGFGDIVGVNEIPDLRAAAE